MNTSKQVNVMIGLLFLAFLAFGAYIVWENTRAADAREQQREMFAERGADLFILNCANCHGIEGLGPEDGAFAPPLQRDSYLIFREDNPHGAPETPEGEVDELWDFLFFSIACGRQGTEMPVWHERYGGSLSEIQVNYLVTMITEDRWDLVAEAWQDYLDENDYEDTEEQREDYLMEPGGAVTEENCGQFTNVTAREFHDRDPFAEPGEEPADPDDPDATPEPGMVAGFPPGEYFASVCASCHGVDRAGGIGPALTPDAMTQDAEFYEDTISEGRGAMPQWGGGDELSDEELDTLVEYLMTEQP